MGKLAANAGTDDAVQIREDYFRLLLETLEIRKTPAGNMNVLQHIMGYFKNELSHDEKEEMLEILDRYRSGYVPLIVPITLLNHYTRKYNQPYLGDQYYLNPHPFEIGLLNHV